MKEKTLISMENSMENRIHSCLEVKGGTLDIEWFETDTKTFSHIVIVLFFTYLSVITIGINFTFLIEPALNCT